MSVLHTLTRIFKAIYVPVFLGVLTVFGFIGALKLIYASCMVLLAVLFEREILIWVPDLLFGFFSTGVSMFGFMHMARSSDVNFAKNLQCPESEG